MTPTCSRVGQAPPDNNVVPCHGLVLGYVTAKPSPVRTVELILCHAKCVMRCMTYCSTVSYE